MQTDTNSERADREFAANVPNHDLADFLRNEAQGRRWRRPELIPAMLDEAAKRLDGEAGLND